MEDDEIIQDMHECGMTGERSAVQVVSIKDHETPWVLRIYMDKLINHTSNEAHDIFNIQIAHCPFCGSKL